MRLAIQASYKSVEGRVWQVDALELLESLEPGSVSLIISSPPYFMGKEYDQSVSLEDFISQHERIFPLLVRAIKPGGSICWQVGNHVQGGKVIPLDALVYGVASKISDLVLRNRIVWMFNHGVHCGRRFSGRHETILWFTKGNNYTFDLDAVRVPQKYPGKRHYKGPRKGDWSGNPLGKNPGDVWDIPNVKARHVEKTEHPCQFPTALVRRCILALTAPADVIADPFLGSGTSCIAALMAERNFVGSEIKSKYVEITRRRIRDLLSGQVRVRPDKPTRLPRKGEAVALAPPHFAIHSGS